MVYNTCLINLTNMFLILKRSKTNFFIKVFILIDHILNRLFISKYKSIFDRYKILNKY